MYRGSSSVDRTGVDSVVSSMDVFNARKRGVPKHPNHQQHSNAYHPHNQQPLLHPSTTKQPSSVNGPNGMDHAAEQYDLTLPDWMKNPQVPGLPSWSKLTKGKLHILQNLRLGWAVFYIVIFSFIASKWSEIGNHPTMHVRLISSAYSMVDTMSMMSAITNRGFVSPSVSSPFIYMGTVNPGFKVLTNNTILHHTQPVLIRTDGDVEAYTLSPSKTCTNNMLTNNNTAIWSACRASGVPMSLVDLTYLDNTLSLFGSNNVMALIYQTIFITMVISIATLPPKTLFMPNQEVSWVYLSLILLLGNFVFTVTVPLSTPGAHYPVNNAAIATVLHVVTACVLAMLAKSKDTESTDPDDDSSSNADSSDAGPSAMEVESDTAPLVRKRNKRVQFKLHFLGRHLVASDGGKGAPTYSNLYGRIHKDNVTGKPHVTEVLRFMSNDHHVEGNEVLFDTNLVHYGGMYDNIVGGVQNALHMVSSYVVDPNWVKTKEGTQTMVNVRYFEYSMTAGLFLVCTILTVDRAVDIYVLHMAYMAMLFCNIVAIPITYGVVFWEKFKSQGDNASFSNDYGIWLILSMICVLFASMCFFVSGMVVAIMATFHIMLQAPQVVQGFYYTSLGIYFCFAVGGMAFIYILLFPGTYDSMFAFRKTIKNQLMYFEVLNIFKACLATVFYTSVVTTAGLSL